MMQYWKQLSSNRAYSIIATCCAGFLLIAVLTGCERPAPPLKPGMLRISPASIFDDQTRPLEPHLRLTTGAAKIEYSGPKKQISCGYEIWRDGEIVQKAFGSCMTHVIRPPFVGIASVSLKDVSNYTGKPQYEFIFALDGGSATQLIDMPDTSERFASTKALTNPIVISDEEECAVRSYVVGKDAGMRLSDDSITENAKKKEWVLVVKVKVGDS